MNNKKITAIMLCVLFALILCACNTDIAEEGGATSTAKATEKTAATATVDITDSLATESTPTPTPTPEPTPEPTPMPTIEPGKETYAGGIAAEEAVEYTFVTTGTTNQHRMVNESVAIQFFATVAFNDISISCPSYNDDIGTLQFDLYAWQGSYEATLAEGNNPVASATFENYKDNAHNKMTFDTPLPDGEYLLYMTTPNAEEQVGIWAATDLEGEPESRLYMDDMEDIGFAAGISINYIKTPNVMAGAILPSGLED